MEVSHNTDVETESHTPEPRRNPPRNAKRPEHLRSDIDNLLKL